MAIVLAMRTWTTSIPCMLILSTAERVATHNQLDIELSMICLLGGIRLARFPSMDQIEALAVYLAP